MYNRQLRWTLLFLLALMTGNVLAQEETVSQPSTAPTVYASETYEIEVTTHIYAQGLTHSDWGSEDAEVMDLHLDVYEPIGAPDNRPVMMIIHGGAFRLGSRDDGRFVSMSEYFASRGWVTISIDYRLAGDFGTFPQSWQDGIQEVVDPSAQDSTMPIYAASRDAKAAVRWVYANAETYQINTDYITALGMSAGASLAIMLGTTDAEIYRDELTVEEDSTLASTNLDQPTDIQTVVAFSMSSAANTLIERIYGINTFDATDAPLIFIHGTNDR
ncbi:MAG: alpha/beta hydrolase, partial [Chloroflexota bacterium]